MISDLRLSDCCIAVASARAKATLLTLDSHFVQMEKEAGIRLVRLPRRDKGAVIRAIAWGWEIG